MNPQWVVLAQLSSTVILALCAVIAALAYLRHIRREDDERRAELTERFNRQEESLKLMSYELIASGDPARAREFFGRYWRMKFEQFEAWHAGQVDIGTFTLWFHRTLTQLKSEEQMGGLTLFESWRAIGQHDLKHVNPWFNGFIEELVTLKAGEGPLMQELLRSVETVHKRSRSWRKKRRGEMSVKFFREALRK